MVTELNQSDATFILEQIWFTHGSNEHIVFIYYLKTNAKWDMHKCSYLIFHWDLRTPRRR